MPDLFVSGAEQHWRAMSLSCNLPWFILTFQLTDKGWGIQHSVCVWWESDVIELVSNDSSGRLVSLGLMRPPWSGEDQSWSLCPIKSVWRAEDSLNGGADVLVFRDFDGNEICDLVSDVKPRVGITNRKLLFNIDEPPCGTP